MASKKHKTGPFKEAIYPESEQDLRQDTMVRYKTTDAFKKVAAFYREQYDGLGRPVQLIEGESDGAPTFCVSIGPEYHEVGFSVIIVMTNPASLKRGKAHQWILVMKAE